MVSTKLLVKNLPPQFTHSDKTDFLKLFGADEVVVMSEHGHMRGCCFVSFPDVVTARQAMDALHQFEVLERVLVAEYAKPQHVLDANYKQSKDILNNIGAASVDEKTSSQQKSDEKKRDNEESFVCPKLGVNNPFPDDLVYKYPDPNVTILTNIANAMASVPKFYTQVLHLMNKMNLPTPFGEPTLTPPLPGARAAKCDVAVDTEDLPCGDNLSSDESELESDSDEKRPEIYQRVPSQQHPVVRKRKRLKVMKTVEQEKLNIFQLKKPESVASAFELPQPNSTHLNDTTLATSIKEAVERRACQPPVHFSVFDERGDFGKIEPIPREQKEEEKEEEEEEKEEKEHAGYISLKQLSENRISSQEILQMNQFKKYTRGERTNRLYIKNLAKQVVESDLRFIFNRFAPKKGLKGEGEGDELDIRLMQEGRMKGQAFVTFPDEMVAEKALDAVHGFVLHEKPMVIQFGRVGK